MNEITKLYENAGIKCLHPSGFCKHIGAICEVCERHEYPPFTSDKQLEIVKMILFSTWWMNLKRLQFSEKFDEGLAQMINELWQDFTPEEKQQVKGILE